VSKTPFVASKDTDTHGQPKSLSYYKGTGSEKSIKQGKWLLQELEPRLVRQSILPDV
jgi:hypothetical protein